MPHHSPLAVETTRNGSVKILTVRRRENNIIIRIAKIVCVLVMVVTLLTFLIRSRRKLKMLLLEIMPHEGRTLNIMS